ncbi:MAG: hypothetical protein P8M21_03025 [Halioglobus sp.]|nr:hypothetical protein [Halioglobus sp.]
MLNQLLKVTLISSFLLWLRPRWRGMLALALVVALVHVLHAEYLGYVELSGNDALLIWSFVVKWSVLAVAITVYLAMTLTRQQGKGAPMDSRRKKNAPAGKTVSFRSEDDGFEFLRKKKRLESRAEKMLSGHKS